MNLVGALSSGANVNVADLFTAAPADPRGLRMGGVLRKKGGCRHASGSLTMLTAAFIALIPVLPAQVASAQDCDIPAEVFNDVERIRRCLEAGVTWERTWYGGTILHRVARWTSNPTVVSLFLDAGYDPNAKDDDGSTPLHWAGANENAMVTWALVEGGARVNARNNPGTTPLYAAIWRGNRMAVSVLLDAGADVEVKAYGYKMRTPLHDVSGVDDPLLLSMLLDAGADLRARDASGYTTLHLAVTKRGNQRVVEALLDRGADPLAESDDGRMPLLSVLHPRRDLGHGEWPDLGHISALLRAGAGENLTPLELSILLKDTTGLNQLLGNGADPNETDRYGWAPLHFAVSLAGLETVSSLLAAGADPDAPTGTGATALSLAVRHAPVSIVDALLGAGAEPNMSDSGYGWRPLEGAVRHRAESLQAVITSLLQAGADPGLSDGSQNVPGYSLLHWAVTNSAVKAPVIRALLEAGADPMARDSTGDTPLHIAAIYADETDEMANIIELLLEAGADLKAENEGGLRPVDRAGDIRGSEAFFLLVVPEGKLAPGRTLNGSLSSSDGIWEPWTYHDAWIVTAAEVGQRIVIDMESDEVDTYLSVFRKDGTPVATDDDGGSGSNARVEFLAAHVGDYFVIATSYGEGETGRYRVGVK